MCQKLLLTIRHFISHTPIIFLCNTNARYTSLCWIGLCISLALTFHPHIRFLRIQNNRCAQAHVRAPSFSCTQIVLTGYPSEDTLILILIRNLHEACSDRWSGPMCQYTCDGCCDIEMLVTREGVLVAPPRSPLTQ